MKVALCHHYSMTFHGGGERFLTELAKQLAKKGHEVTIYALPFGHRTVDMSKWLQGIEYHEGFIHFIGDVDVAYFIYAPVLHNLFLGDCPKIAGIHAFVFALELQHHEIASMNYANFLKKFGFSRFISSFYFNKIARKKLDRFDAVHVINKAAVELLNVNKRLYYVPIWIDTSKFRPTEKKNEKFSALFVGRKNKGFSTFVNVAELLRKREIEFLAIGPDVKTVQNVKGLGLITDVKELINLYSRAHVLVYSSKLDVFPLTLLETCSCGTPVVATYTKALKELKLPIFFETTEQGFAKHILRLENLWKTSCEDYLKLTKKVRVGVTKYDVNKVFPRFLNMLEETVQCSDT